MKSKNLLMSLAAALAAAGCATTPSGQNDEQPPPKANRVQVLMYDTTPRPKTRQLDYCGAIPPRKPYKVIALLTCEGAVDQEVVMTTAIYYRARQIGADGVMDAGTITTQKQTTLNVADTVEKQIAMNVIGLGGSGARSVFRASAFVYTTPSPEDSKATSDLLGHWTSTAIKGASEGVSKIEFTFLPGNRVVAVTTLNSKTYPINGRYAVEDGKFAIAEDKDLRPDISDFSLVEDSLTVSFPSGQKVTLKKGSE